MNLKSKKYYKVFSSERFNCKRIFLKRRQTRIRKIYATSGIKSDIKEKIKNKNNEGEGQKI